MGNSRGTAAAGTGEAPVDRNAASCFTRGRRVESVERPRLVACFGQTCYWRGDESHIAASIAKPLQRRRNNPRAGPLTLRQETASRDWNQTAFWFCEPRPTDASRGIQEKPLRRKVCKSQRGVLPIDAREREPATTAHRPRISAKQGTPSVMKRTGSVAQASDCE